VKHRKRRVSLVAIAAGTVLACLATAGPAAAQPDVEVIASGLDNPRGLAFANDGSLLVAEAGRGGPGPCFPGPEGGDVCFGTTGAVTRIDRGRHERVLEGLPSIAAPDGSAAIGPSDVAPKGRGQAFVTFGLGADPARRDEIPELADTARLVQARLGPGTWTSVADIGDFEAAQNPDGQLPDSNPNSVWAVPSGHVVSDAGGNSLLLVSNRGTITTLATFPDQMVPAPPFLGLPPGTLIPMDFVPTSVVQGPDGAFYVGQLTGFPFPVGGARVHRVVQGQAPQVVATGFTNIIDIGFGRGGELFVLEMFHNGLLSGDPTGALIRVRSDGSKETVMSEGLTTPGGLVLQGRRAYVSNCGTCPGGGEVLRIDVG
jgi:hypothetical protein